MIVSSFLFVLLGPVAASGDSSWDARHAEHLLNRAGFGASPAEIAAAVEAGRDATIDRLLGGSNPTREDRYTGERPLVRAGIPMPERMTDGPVFPQAADGTTERFYLDRGRRWALGVVRNYCADWVGSMLEGDDPVRERMAIFWHGHFVSAFETVRDPHAMVKQLEFLRTNALGDFRTLVEGIARDPAMLEYLNNNINEKLHPNENWARELMELFTLGEGHYSEDDIKETARAFTGWSNRGLDFVFQRELHDYGPKTVLGVTGQLDGGDVIDILLDREQCARFLVWKMIAYFEGVEPTDERVTAYAAILRDSGYETETFLRALFADPEFYRDEIQGQRIAAPVEYFVGMARRMEVDPPPSLIFVAAGILGQKLVDPPNVKGWEEGAAWMTTNSVMQRGNLIGTLLGELGSADQRSPEQAMRELIETRGRAFGGPYRDYLAMAIWFDDTQWSPAQVGFIERLAELGETADEAVVRDLLERILAVPPPPGSEARVLELVERWRKELELADAALLDAGPEGREVLLRLAHVVLSLPEAQLN